MRLVIGRPFGLTVKNKNGKKVFDKDLVQTMMATGHYNTQEDFDRELNYNVVVKISESSIVITINGWIAVEIEPDL